MVKPQSSKLITRVRFPSSPRTIPPTLSGGFFVLGDERESLPHVDLFPRALGIFALQLVIPSTSHPHKTPYKTKGDRGVRAQWK